VTPRNRPHPFQPGGAGRRVCEPHSSAAWLTVGPPAPGVVRRALREPSMLSVTCTSQRDPERSRWSLAYACGVLACRETLLSPQNPARRSHLVGSRSSGYCNSAFTPLNFNPALSLRVVLLIVLPGGNHDFPQLRVFLHPFVCINPCKHFSI